MSPAGTSEFERAERELRRLRRSLRHLPVRLVSAPIDLALRLTGRRPRRAPPSWLKRALLARARAELAEFLASDRRLAFACADPPALSIVSVLFNRAELTLRCLRALAELPADLRAELILVDNGSSDATGRLLERLDGVRIVRNRGSLHFLRGCNQGAALARGGFLLLLNNDTVPAADAVPAAMDVIAGSADVGAVGARLILPDGTLQEAGGIVRQDGTVEGYGRGRCPDDPEFVFRRDVHYCTGAFLLLRTEQFRALGGLDEAYAPAYYEDVDLCLRLAARGLRIVYEPQAVVRHFEFGSSGDADALALQRRSRAVFIARHGPALAARPSRPQSAAAVRGLAPAGRRVLVVDDFIPVEDVGAGVPRMRAVLGALDRLGCAVTYYPTNPAPCGWDRIYAENPRTIEIIRNGHGRRLGRFLAERAGCFDFVLLSRVTNFRRLRGLLRANPSLLSGARLICDFEAIFCLRDVARRRLAGEPIDEHAADELVRQEAAQAADAWAVTAVSAAEADRLRRAGLRNVRLVSCPADPAPTPTPFAARRGFLFVGPCMDDEVPNTDGLCWFVSEVMPRLRRRPAGATLTVVGRIVSPRAAALAGPDVRLAGPAADATPYYDAARVFISPVRYAAGIPLKLLFAAARGVPAVATPLTAGQLGLTDGVDALVGGDAEAFAEQCARLHEDRVLWESVRAAALERVARRHDAASFDAALRDLLFGSGAAGGG
jgi:GT2 family glycosyltransferase/glycosyltransferase involved in cell wall biosynthesis